VVLPPRSHAVRFASDAICATAAADVVGGDGTLTIVDGHALAYRMHFALLKTKMATEDGVPSHALHGFCTKLVELHARNPLRRMLVAFDLPGPTFRTADLNTYKATRPSMPDALRHQIDAMRDACACMGVPAVSATGFEADDVIASCVSAASASSGETSLVEIVANDKDMMQLVSLPDASPRVFLWNDVKKKVVDAAAVEAQFGVQPAQMGDLIALMGDSSDNVPGVPGIGPKGAAKLLIEHGDLEGVLSAALDMKQSKRKQALLEHADTARQARRLVALRSDVPLETSIACGAVPRIASDEFLDFLRRWEMHKVERKVAALAADHS